MWIPGHRWWLLLVPLAGRGACSGVTLDASAKGSTEGRWKERPGFSSRQKDDTRMQRKVWRGETALPIQPPLPTTLLHRPRAPAHLQSTGESSVTATSSTGPAAPPEV
ncbi:unnamed protein product, partial [Amoebophrya sp. A25]|eukprot:GSA25T00013564001.1